MVHLRNYLFASLVITCFALVAIAQPQVEDTTEYVSDYDNSLTFLKMTYLPSLDNVNNVYSKAMDEELKALIESNHKWGFVETPISSAKLNPEDLVTNSETVKSFAKTLGADGFLLAELRKDPKITKIRMYLFSARSGDLITEEELERTTDNTEIIKVAIRSLYQRILEKIPYDALVSSRTDNRVTINAGKRDGVSVGQTLTAVKIIGAKKHPKRNFIIKSQKALLGQIRIVKVDEYLSFGDIVSESESGVITKDVKLTGISNIHYQATPWTKNYTPAEQLLSKDNKVVFGKNAREWVAKDPPTFGKVGADFSIGTFNNNLALADGNSYNSKNNTYPRINFSGELWITPKWYGEAQFAQGIGQSQNHDGTQEVSNSLTQYRLAFGYNFILRNEFFGPKLSVDLGFSSYRMFVDGSSDSGFTTVQFRSIPLGIGGYVPINPSKTWAIGGKAYLHLFPRLKETPVSSGSDSDSTINQFQFYAENKISQRLRWKVGLEFLLLSSNFDGSGGRTIPANNLSQRFTLISTGIDYLF